MCLSWSSPGSKRSISRKRRRETLKAKGERGLTVNASNLIDTMKSITRCPRSKTFELACALSFVSGRGLAKVVATAECSPSSNESGHDADIYTGSSRASAGRIARILLLCELPYFMEGVRRLPPCEGHLPSHGCGGKSTIQQVC